MGLQRRAWNSLPAYLQTNYNNLSDNVSTDPLFEPEQAKFVNGYIGDTSKLTPKDLARTPLLIENSPIRQKYQFTVGIAQSDPVTQNYTSGCFYDDLLNHLTLNGAITNNPNRLFGAYYYAWTPPIDYDKIVNPSQYFWTGNGNASDGHASYVVKEAAGSQIIIHQYVDGVFVPNSVKIVNDIPSIDWSPVDGEIVEDLSTFPNRYLKVWKSGTWEILNFRVVDDIPVTTSNYVEGDYIYVCRTGINFNCPIVWVYRPKIGRWVSISVVIDITPPETPIKGMIWEDATVPLIRVLRIYDGSQWQELDYIKAPGPSGTPSDPSTYLYDTRSRSDVDSWSAQNWWRCIADLSLSDRGSLHAKSQGARPIIEFWGNIETADANDQAAGSFIIGQNYVIKTVGDTNWVAIGAFSNTAGISFTASGAGAGSGTATPYPRFNVYGVAPNTSEIVKIDSTNFPGLPADANISSTIFGYDSVGGTIDSVLGFKVNYSNSKDNGTLLFNLDLETLPITINGVDLLGYRYFLDTATGFVHSIWEKADNVLVQTMDSDGFYSIPLNLQYNPDHIILGKDINSGISRSSYINHFASVIKSQENFSGTPYGPNNYRFTSKNLTAKPAYPEELMQVIDPEESLQRIMSVLQTNQLDIPDAIRQMSRDYNKVMARFLNQLKIYWDNGTLSTPMDTLPVAVTIDNAVDAILTQIFFNRNSEFPYHYSVMGTYINTVILNGAVLIYDTTPQPIYIPDSAVCIGASRPYVPQKILDDGMMKIRGHDGSLIPAFGDVRDDVILNLENRFFAVVPDYFKTNSTFRLDEFFGNFTPIPSVGPITEIVDDYTVIVSPNISPRANNQIYSVIQQVYATWDGDRWIVSQAQVNDVFLNQDDGFYYIFNGFYAIRIVTFNRKSANNADYNFDYSENDFKQIIQREFERWVITHKLDFITNDDYDPNDPFTWNFSSAGVEGNWRGIYRRIYSTVFPHSRPWEIIGYSIMPEWWLITYIPDIYVSDEPRYGSAHQMWIDLQSGMVNGSAIPSKNIMTAPIPVDGSGNLLDPIAAGVVNETALIPSALGDDWAYGDGGPIEQKFYDSYYFQFAIALAGYLMKPALFVDRTWTQYYREVGNIGIPLWNGPAIVYNTTLTRPRAADVPSQLSLDLKDNIVTNPGLNAWIAEYTSIIGLSPNANFNSAIQNCTATLGWKTSGFINTNRTVITLLNGDEIPTDDLNVILHQGPSLNEYYQSGIIIVRDIDGFRIFGTDVLNPYFTVDVGIVPTSGGVIEQLESFTYDGVNIHPKTNSSIAYIRSSIKLSEVSIPPSTNDSATFSVLVNGYRVPNKYIQKIDSTSFSIDPVLALSSGDNIVVSVINTVSNPSTSINSFTVNGVQVTYFASGSGQLINYPYGHLFRTLNDVANMMVGYGRFLLSQGWVFERLTNGQLRDWIGAAKAFAIWSTDLSIKYNGNPLLMKDNVFQFSVMGRQTEFNAPFGMILGIEDIRNGSYGVVDVDNQPIRSNNLTVVSMPGNVVVSSDDTDIFGLRLYISEIQHVVFFSDISIFGDVIYEPVLGLKQDVVFVDTYRTTNWSGRLEAPGFLISGGQIGSLSPDSTPTPYGALFPNWEKQIADVTRYYDRFNPPDDTILTGMARASFGYIPQSYMNELDVDDRIQFNFFRGSLKSKGTFKPYQAFIRGTTIDTDKCVIAEDWAWKFTRYGDRRQVVVLFNVNQGDFVDVFQAIHFDPAPPVSDTISAVFDTFFLAANPTRNNIETGISIRPHGTFIFYDGVLQPNSSYSVIDEHIICPIDSPLSIYALVVGDVADDAFIQTFKYGDGFTTDFYTQINQTINSVVISINGVIQAPQIDYTINDNIISFADIPKLEDVILITEAKRPMTSAVYHFVGGLDGDVAIKIFSPEVKIDNYRHIIVSINGIVQAGPNDKGWTPDYIITLDGDLSFVNAPELNANIDLFIFELVMGGVLLVSLDDRVIHIPQFLPPNSDSRWIIPPSPPDLYIPAGTFIIEQTYTIEFLGDTDWVAIGAPSNTVGTRFMATGVGTGTGMASSDLPYRFPIKLDNTVDYVKFLYTAAIVDQTTRFPAITLFHWDPKEGLHEPLASSLIDYKIAYDPAFYNHGPLAGSGNNMLIWGPNQVGHVWWNDTAAIYSEYKKFLPDYMKVKQEWGKLLYFNASITRNEDLVTVVTLDPANGLPIINDLIDGQTVIISGADQPTYNGTMQIVVASPTSFTFTVEVAADIIATGNIIVQVGIINCYEWVASPVLPSAWSTYLKVQSGFDVYTGTILNEDTGTVSYVSQEVWDINGNPTTTYYFWVQNNGRVIPSKNMCVRDIAGRLTNPSEYLVPYFGILDSATMFVFSGDYVVEDDSAIEVTYWWHEMPQHIEWLLIGENDDFNTIPPLVTDKLLDSILGSDTHGNPVPNVTLAPCDIYGSSFFPAQTVFQNAEAALDIYITSVNSLLANIDINTIPMIFNGLALSDQYTNYTNISSEQNNIVPNSTLNGLFKPLLSQTDIGKLTIDISNLAGYWYKTTWWDPRFAEIVYDTVVNSDELIFNTNLGLYTVGDIVKQIESDAKDPWTDEQVASYYRYTGTDWELVGINNHAVAINTNIAQTPTIFRAFFNNLVSSITKIQANVILFTLLYEMVRQNPLTDWFFKTSYIDIHISQPIPITSYVFPDQATIISEVVLNLKPYRTKLRDQITSYLAEEEDVPVLIEETQTDMYTLIFDRVACDLTDENSWDTIPWDATVTYPETQNSVIHFVGGLLPNGNLQQRFILPEVVPLEELVVFFDGHLIASYNYIYSGNSNLYFLVAPEAGVLIDVVIDGTFRYLSGFDYSFLGNGLRNNEVLPNQVEETTINNIFSSWNGVYQLPVTDFHLQVTSDVEIIYDTIPTAEIEVNGTVFGGVVGNIFANVVYTADGSTTLFSITTENQSLDTIVVSINGVWQTPGIDYTIDNITHTPDSYVNFNIMPNSGDLLSIYTIENPNWVVSTTYVFVGNGIITDFSIIGLDAPIQPMVFVNIDGIQQNIDVGNFSITSTGLNFDSPPAEGVNIAIFVVWSGIGQRLPGSGAYPSTIQWDWAFWDYATLGTEEFDLGGFFLGDGITESFSVAISQATSLLYPVVVKFFKNGMAVSLDELGLTMTLTKLATSVIVALSDVLPVEVYGALYVARGFYEGLSIGTTTFGYQDPNGVVFAPTPSSYQHFFARLISPIFDPSTIMSGCPDHTPEERIQQEVEDSFTICVQTDVEVLPAIE